MTFRRIVVLTKEKVPEIVKLIEDISKSGSVDYISKTFWKYAMLRIDNSLEGRFCCGCSILSVVVSLHSCHIHNKYHIKADF